MSEINNSFGRQLTGDGEMSIFWALTMMVQLVGCYLLFLKVEERLHDRRTSCAGNRTLEQGGMLRERNMMRTCPECGSMLTVYTRLAIFSFTDG